MPAALFPSIAIVKMGVTESLEGMETIAVAGVVSVGAKVIVNVHVLFGSRFALVHLSAERVKKGLPIIVSDERLRVDFPVFLAVKT